MTALALTAVPPHVPESRVRDVDIYHLPGAEDDMFVALWEMQQNNPDVFWTPRNGGHWILTRGEDLYPMFANVELMSNKQVGIPVTHGAMPYLPIESDPPIHGEYRKIVQPWFLPKKVEKLISEVARPLAIKLIEGFREKGECEFIADFAKQLPIVVFMQLMGLPIEDADLLLPLVEVSVRNNDLTERQAAFEKMSAYIEARVEEWRAKPPTDLLGSVVHATIQGRSATHMEIMGLCFNLLNGGLDTVSSTMGFFARFLADHPSHRQQLAADQTLIPNAVAELLRRFGVANPGKMAAKDFVYREVEFKKGDMVMFPTGLHGLDSRKFDRPLEVDFTRTTPISSVFGNGPHRCPGSHLAREELKMFLEEWLSRIPDFQVKPGEKPVCGGGGVYGMTYLPLVWEPRANDSMVNTSHEVRRG